MAPRWDDPIRISPQSLIPGIEYLAIVPRRCLRDDMFSRLVTDRNTDGQTDTEP